MVRAAGAGQEKHGELKGAEPGTGLIASPIEDSWGSIRGQQQGAHSVLDDLTSVRHGDSGQPITVESRSVASPV